MSKGEYIDIRNYTGGDLLQKEKIMDFLKIELEKQNKIIMEQL